MDRIRRDPAVAGRIEIALRRARRSGGGGGADLPGAGVGRGIILAVSKSF
jgi:hypothetical protein